MRARSLACALACALLPATAQAEVIARFGIGVGGMQVLANPRLAVTPHVSVDWASDWLTIGVRDELGLLPSALGGRDTNMSIHNRTALLLGFATPRVTSSLGPTLTIYSMSACSPVLCAWTAGVAVGAEAQISVWTTEWFNGIVGIQASGYVGYYNGSAVLHNTVIGQFSAGPVFRIGAWR